MLMSFIQVTILALVVSQAGGVHGLLDVGGLIDDVLGLLDDLIGIIVSVLGVGVNLDLGIRLGVNVRVRLGLDTNVLQLGTIYLGFGHNGNIIGSGFRSTPRKCIDACDKNVLCKVASWDERGICYLHYRLDECNVIGYFHNPKSLLFVKEDDVLGLLDGVLGLLGGVGIDLGIRLGVDLETHHDGIASGYIYIGFGHIGNCIALGVEHSASDCINACLRDAKCKGSTWDGRCRHHFMIDNTKVIKHYRRDNSLLFVKISLIGCVYPGFGHSGNNIRSGFSSTPSECINECYKSGRCKGSTWDKNNQCWPHSIIDESKVSGNFQGGNSQLFVRECLIGRRYPSFGHNGNNIKGGFSTNAGGCAAACIAEGRCAGSTWDKDAKCWLHSKIEEIRVSGNFQDGKSELFVKTSLTGCRYPSFGHTGNDIKGGFSTNAGGCAAACIADDKCAGSTWDKNAKCWLHFKIEESRVSGNFQGGKSELFVKLCLAGCRYPSYGQKGNDLKGGFSTNAGGCAAACIAEDRCAGSTWDKDAKCWLHSKMEQSRISGNFQGGKSELFVKNCQKM